MIVRSSPSDGASDLKRLYLLAIATKTLVVHSMLSIFGSANFDNRSLELNDEVNLAALNRPLASRFVHDFEKDLRASRRLTLDTWRKRPFTEKAHEHFWSYFADVF